MSVSPGQIAIAIHYWTTPGDYDGGESQHWHSSFVQRTLAEFVSRGLLTRPGRDGVTYQSTDALGVWVKALCQVPFPVQEWVIPNVQEARKTEMRIEMEREFGK